ncbi:hypothetical protein QBC37DRAFT_435791 [Rhypophila decipiens]|uniref:Uncharacterized protein n=1 Tax=Rhypophila decipiens TaxID=261697 RepID=A0AAN6XSQ7_9PEZI|nr:hypothetical protein QBC37DRAFT_435791 [Rhypophila decipiens]
MEKPYGLVDFVQQTGRGGRRAGEVAQMEAFVSTPGCRRAVISAFMDGAAGKTCKDVDGARLCRGRGRYTKGGGNGHGGEG